MPLCNAGVTQLKTSVGFITPLFVQSSTSPSLRVGVGDNICYADLIAGSGCGINITYNDDVYHANEFMGCPKSFQLSFDCGAGAAGAPAAREIEWGSLFSINGDTDVCNRPSYIFNGWSSGGTNYTTDEYYQYLTEADTTLTANWSSIDYGIAYTCGTCDFPFVMGSTDQYITTSSGKNVTVSSSMPTGCSNPQAATLTGFKIQYADGTDTGDTVAPGGTFVYKYDDNLRLAAMWRENPATYTLTYNCGDGATGTPPKSRTVKYNKLFNSGADIGTCNRPGYYVSGWKIDSTSYSFGGYGTYSYNTDKTITAQWSQKSYGAAYVCNNGGTSSEYLSIKGGATYTPSTTVCTAPAGKTFAGYAVQYADGVDTGDSVAPGESFTFNYDENIRLSAIWE